MFSYNKTAVLTPGGSWQTIDYNDIDNWNEMYSLTERIYVDYAWEKIGSDELFNPDNYYTKSAAEEAREQALLSYINDGKYNSQTKKIELLHDNNVIAAIDATPFIIDGMVDDVRIENGNLIIDFNAASGKQDISIPITDIFNPANYYTKSEADDRVVNILNSAEFSDNNAGSAVQGTEADYTYRLYWKGEYENFGTLRLVSATQEIAGLMSSADKKRLDDTYRINFFDGIVNLSGVTLGDSGLCDGVVWDSSRNTFVGRLFGRSGVTYYSTWKGTLPDSFGPRHDIVGDSDEYLDSRGNPRLDGIYFYDGLPYHVEYDGDEGISILMTSRNATSTKEGLMSAADKTKLDNIDKDLEEGNLIPALAYNLEAWADQKAIATPDTYTDAVRTTGGDIPIETSAGSKLESIKPIAGSKWTAKLLFNGSYNMLNAAKWGAANSQPYVGGIGSDFVYFLVPELILGTFGTADENNGLLFTNSEGESVIPVARFKPLGSNVPSSLTDGTDVQVTVVQYDGNYYNVYTTSEAGWMIIPKSHYDADVCAHIAWEDWYDKYVSLDEPVTNPEAVVGTLMLEGLLALAHSDKYLRGINEEVCDNIVFGDTSATISHVVDELSVAANAWTNSATGESDSQGNALYRHSTTVSGIKQGGAACVEGNDSGIPLTVNGTTVSYIDTNATAPASVVFYQIPTTEVVEKAYTDNVFSGSNIDVETGIMPINDCSIEAQIAMDGEANITVKYAKNIVDQVAINATVDVPQIQKQVENHEERITELEDTAVRTGSYDASVAVGLADNFKGDTIVDAEFYKRKTGGTQNVGSGIAAIKEVRGKSIVWNQLMNNVPEERSYAVGGKLVEKSLKTIKVTVTDSTKISMCIIPLFVSMPNIIGHKIYVNVSYNAPEISNALACNIYIYGNPIGMKQSTQGWVEYKKIVTATSNDDDKNTFTWNPSLDDTEGMYREFTYPVCIDLTLMFGAGNEPATVEDFEKMFPLDYYEYNAGEVIPFAGQNLVTTGFNQFNQDAFFAGKSGITKEGDYYVGNASMFPGVFFDNKQTKFSGAFAISIDYQVSSSASTYLRIKYTDGTDDGYLWLSNGHNIFITKSSKTLATLGLSYGISGTVKVGNICVSFQSDKDGTYEPYEKHTLPLDPSQWRDKDGNLVFPYGGMHGVGTAYDYAKVDSDGYIRKAVRCFGQVDLGSLTWNTKTVDDKYCFISYDQKYLSKRKAITPKYSWSDITTQESFVSNAPDKSFGIRTTLHHLYIKDSAYATTADFKTAMQGVPLIYELAEPVEVELATPVYAKYLVDKDGTEEITPANGTTPYTTPANLSILYAMDARGEIKNLPKNYLSKESAESMLNAMVSAGVIASYTMTYDAASGRYAFVITKPAEESTNTVNNEENI